MGPDNICDTTNFLNCAKNGHKACLQHAVTKGFSVDFTDRFGNTALILACKYGHTDCVIFLLENNAQMNAEDMFHNSALMYALKGLHVECAKLLITHGANIQGDAGIRALHRAALCGLDDLVSLLLDKGVDVNGQVKDGETALIAAVSKGQIEVVSILIQHGANLDLIDYKGRTALIHAVLLMDNEVIIKLLVEHKANLNIQDVFGRTALIYAVREPQPEIIRFFLEQATDIKIADDNGLTPLGWLRKMSQSVQQPPEVLEGINLLRYHTDLLLPSP